MPQNRGGGKGRALESASQGRLRRPRGAPRAGQAGSGGLERRRSAGCRLVSLVVSRLRNAVVGPIDLTVEPGRPAAIAGPSGAGKSVFLRLVADLDPGEGDVQLGETSRAAVPAPTWRRHVTYLAAEPGWWAPTFAAHVPAGTQDAAAALAGRLGLGEEVLARPLRLASTGERQRLALVRALVREPQALLLDEPTGALDPEAVARVETLLLERARAGLVLLLVSHDPAQARRLGARCYAMRAGRLDPA